MKTLLTKVKLISYCRKAVGKQKIKYKQIIFSYIANQNKVHFIYFIFHFKD